MLFKQKIYKSILIIFILLSLALFFRVLNLNRGFSGDESSVVYISQLNTDQILHELEKERGVYPPLTYIFMHYWRYFNESEAWIRLYFVFFGIGTCFATYLIGKEYLDKKLAEITLLLASFSPLLIFASQYTRSYIDSAFWMVLSSLFMLKIIKSKSTLVNWSGYIITATLSLYTFYFSILLLFSQFLFVSVFYWRKKKILLKWYIAFAFIGLIFLPWAPSAFKQFHNVTVYLYDWSDKGFNLGGFRLGLYTRNLSSIAGFDPYFMVYPGGISAHFTKPLLASLIAGGFSSFLFILFISFNYLKKRFSSNRELIWFPIFIIFIPVVASWFCAKFFNMLPNAKYFVAFHAFFLILMAVFINNLWNIKPLFGIIIIALILGIYSLRIPHSISSEFDRKGALSFLEENMSERDCIICVLSCPSGNKIVNVIQLKDYLVLKKDGSKYMIVSQSRWEKVMQKLKDFEKIWFYRSHGNVEIFGANQIVDNYLKQQGYSPGKINKFKNIDIIDYEKLEKQNK